jgi:hypothetical protein
MEVLKVKVDFKMPSSGTIPESPTIFIIRFKAQNSKRLKFIFSRTKE